MLAADYEVMVRYAREDAERTTNLALKALYEAHSRKWLELAVAASRRSEAVARPPVRLLVSDRVTDHGPENGPSQAAA